jgi:hypothetical protein
MLDGYPFEQAESFLVLWTVHLAVPQPTILFFPLKFFFFSSEGNQLQTFGSCCVTFGMGDVRKVVGGALSVALLAASLRFAWKKFVKAPVADKSEVIKLLEADKSEVINLLEVTGDPKLTTVVNALLSAIEDIALAFRHTSQCKSLDTQNSFGDEQLNVDVLSNHIIFKYLKDTGLVSTASSEETPEETLLGGHGFSVAFDPLDGSSIVGKKPNSKLNGR